MKAKTKTNNRLWQARHRAGLEQKQVAHLLGHKTCDQVSRYERGDRLPSLKTAVRLAIILHASVRELFPDLCEQYRARIAESAARLSFALPLADDGTNSLIGAHQCTFEILVLQTTPTDEEIDLARQHSIKLMRELSDVIARRNSRGEH